MSINEMGVEMSFGVGDDVSLTYPLGIHINNGNWHYIALTLEDDKIALYLDGLTGSSVSFTPVKPV